MKEELLNKIAQEVVKSRNSGQRTTNIVKVKTPAGRRFYSGTAVSGPTNFRKSQASYNAMLKYRNNPSDSTTTKQMMRFRGDK
jgi:hypothetical protein